MFGYENSLNSEIQLSGFFYALVVDNMDPKGLERVRVRILGVHDMENTDIDNSIWASHVAPSKSNSGEIPDIGDYLYITFLQNDPMSCHWFGWIRHLSS